MRDLLDRGLRDRDRRAQLFFRLDLPNRVAAQMENDRDRGESDKAVTRRFLIEAVEAREADTLEKMVLMRMMTSVHSLSGSRTLRTHSLMRFAGSFVQVQNRHRMPDSVDSEAHGLGE
jgi:predicted sugar kinase